MKTVELRRHTQNDGDVLTEEGARAAVEIGSRLAGPYDLLISSGAQRATQTLACFLAGYGKPLRCGVTVDSGFQSEIEDRWFAAARATGGGDLNAFMEADAELVATESRRFGEALRRTFALLPEGGRALVVGHSPMHECAVYGLCGEIVTPIAKGAAVVVVEDSGSFRTEP